MPPFSNRLTADDAAASWIAEVALALPNPVRTRGQKLTSGFEGGP